MSVFPNTYLSNPSLSWVRGCQTFSVQGQRVNILDFAVHVVSGTPSALLVKHHLTYIMWIRKHGCASEDLIYELQDQFDSGATVCWFMFKIVIFPVSWNIQLFFLVTSSQQMHVHMHAYLPSASNWYMDWKPLELLFFSVETDKFRQTAPLLYFSYLKFVFKHYFMGVSVLSTSVSVYMCVPGAPEARRGCQIP